MPPPMLYRKLLFIVLVAMVGCKRIAPAEPGPQATIQPASGNTHRIPYARRSWAPEPPLPSAGSMSSDPDNAVFMSCRQDMNGYSQVVIHESKTPDMAPASHSALRRPGDHQPRTTSYRVLPGESAECRFDTKHEVRIRVAAGQAYAHGACGGDPKTFVSIWVDRRKVVSKSWITGHCLTAFGDDAPSFHISGSETRSPVMSKCASPIIVRGDTILPQHGRRSDICVEFPDPASYPIDNAEYGDEAKRRFAVGSVRLLQDSAPFCRRLARSLAERFELYDASALQQLPGAEPIRYDRDRRGGEDIPYFAAEARFDFDNDGTSDRVRMLHGEYNYFDGDAVLVDYGAPGGDMGYFPCQFDGTADYRQCPLIFKDIAEKSFELNVPGSGDKLDFSSRYTTLIPFRVAGTTHVALQSRRSHPDYAFVLIPRPGKRFDTACVLWKVPPNM